MLSNWNAYKFKYLIREGCFILTLATFLTSIFITVLGIVCLITGIFTEFDPVMMKCGTKKATIGSASIFILWYLLKFIHENRGRGDSPGGGADPEPPVLPDWKPGEEQSLENQLGAFKLDVGISPKSISRTSRRPVNFNS